MSHSKPAGLSYSSMLGASHGVVVLAWGWKRGAIAFAAGATGALAMPNWSFAPALIVAASLGVLLLDGAQGGRWGAIRSAFVVGWVWGFGYFLVGLWWLGAAFLVDAAKFAWALPLGVIGLPAALAVFPAFGFAFARAIWSAGPARVFALGAALATTEWLRGLLFTGFPWNDLGMTLGAHLVTAQIASWIGLHGLTLASITLAAAPATLWRADERRIDWRPTGIAVVALAAIVAFGAWRLSAPAAPVDPKVRLRIVQANIAQGESFSSANADAILKTYFNLSDRATSPDANGVADVTHLIWPESAFPFLLARQPAVIRAISDFLRGGAILVTGAARAESANPQDRQPKIFNSIQVVDKAGLRPETYDKQRLVPFGEYLPFSGMLRRIGVTQFVDTPGGFSQGEGDPLLRLPGLPPALARICYEAIFPTELGAGFDPSVASAQWILNLTDDAWFGLTPGPYQHFAQARLRAIELGLPLVRAANSGISAIVDGRGRILSALPLGNQGVIDGRLPFPEPATPQRRYGGAFALALLALSYFFALRSRET